MIESWVNNASDGSRDETLGSVQPKEDSGPSGALLPITYIDHAVMFILALALYRGLRLIFPGRGSK